MNEEIENYMRNINIDDICRICLSDSDEMVSLFNEIEKNDIDEDISFVYQIIMNVSSLQITVNDGLPTLICKSCAESANNAYKFRVLCDRSQLLLHRLQSFFSSNAQIKNEISLHIKDEDDTNIEFIQVPIVQLEETVVNEQDSVIIQNSSEEDNNITNNEEILDAVIDLPDQENENLETYHTIIVNPNMILNENDDSSDKNIVDKNTFETDASLVASTDENIRLRERIKLKKIYANPLKKVRRKRAGFFQSRINENGEKIYCCQYCEKEYKHSASLSVHIRDHTLERPYLCTLCGKDFKQFTGLRYHMRGHNNEHPYKCKLCDKKYRQASSLTTHMRVHTGQRPFLCSVCGKGFRQQPDLGYHMRTHTKEKRYMCNICGKCMSMQCHLVQHMRTHTGERPYACTTCGKAFASSTRLKRHEIIHTGLKPYVCDVCKKAFNRDSSLRIHIMTHLDVKPHVCEVCSKGFTQAHCLRTHMKTHSFAGNS